MGNLYNLAIALAIPALSLTATAAPAHPAIPDADFHKRIEYKARNASGAFAGSRMDRINDINTNLFSGRKAARPPRPSSPMWNSLRIPVSTRWTPPTAPCGTTPRSSNTRRSNTNTIPNTLSRSSSSTSMTPNSNYTAR